MSGKIILPPLLGAIIGYIFSVIIWMVFVIIIGMINGIMPQLSERYDDAIRNIEHIVETVNGIPDITLFEIWGCILGALGGLVYIKNH